jgi:hypothetical protein
VWTPVSLGCKVLERNNRDLFGTPRLQVTCKRKKKKKKKLGVPRDLGDRQGAQRPSDPKKLQLSLLAWPPWGPPPGLPSPQVEVTPAGDRAQGDMHVT